ncbi:MAG: DUF1572 family protein [Saprospiraceae bacterium]
MLKTALQQLFQRDLLKLKAEIAAYQNETLLWKIDKEIKNSGGNLCLHLIGNLNTYIGNGLTDMGYVRQRDFEFAGKNVARTDLYVAIDETIAIVQQGIENLTEAQLQGNFPIVIWDEPTTTYFTLIHLHGHLTYHLGQINYHRRLLDKETI